MYVGIGGMVDNVRVNLAIVISDLESDRILSWDQAYGCCFTSELSRE